MQRESKTRSMAAKKKLKPKKKTNPKGSPQVVLEGMENVLELDIAKHKGILQQTEVELESYRNARAYEVRKKRHYRSLINLGKYDQDAMEAAIEQINVNLRHMADKVKLSNEKIAHHKEILAALEKELENQYKGLKYLEEQRKNGLAD